MGGQHGGYTRDDLSRAGIEENAGDRIRMMSGYKNMEEVRAAAPETEGEGVTPGASGQRGGPAIRRPRLSKSEQEKQAAQEEFDRLRPLLVKKWERRLRIPYSLWARLAADPKVALSDKEATEGAELHVELMQAFGWIHAGKIEAIADLVLWHGATVLGRSELGLHLLEQLGPQQQEQEKPN